MAWAAASALNHRRKAGTKSGTKSPRGPGSALMSIGCASTRDLTSESRPARNMRPWRGAPSQAPRRSTDDRSADDGQLRRHARHLVEPRPGATSRSRRTEAPDRSSWWPRFFANFFRILSAKNDQFIGAPLARGPGWRGTQPGETEAVRFRVMTRARAQERRRRADSPRNVS